MQAKLCWSRRNNLIFLINIIALIIAAGISSAQEEREKVPTLKITMIIVSQLDACKPEGYKGGNEKSKCDPLYPKTVKRWINAGNRKVIKDGICPCNQDECVVIPLGGAMMEALTDYNSDFKKGRARQLESMVLLFEFNPLPTGKVSLVRERLQVNENNKDIEELTWEGNLDHDEHWINHQRADIFLPDTAFQWVLTVGKNQWRFTTGG